jgi:hypothetical protein
MSRQLLLQIRQIIDDKLRQFDHVDLTSSNSGSDGSNDDDIPECSICFNTFAERNLVHCGDKRHIWCISCNKKIGKKCPICRKKTSGIHFVKKNKKKQSVGVRLRKVCKKRGCTTRPYMGHSHCAKHR